MLFLQLEAVVGEATRLMTIEGLFITTNQVNYYESLLDQKQHLKLREGHLRLFGVAIA